MTNQKTLQDRLARSLERANEREAEARPRATSIPPPAAGRKCAKLGISLFQTDLARLNEICSYMAARGHRISTSQAVKLALRTVPLSDDLTAALAAVRMEDGRAHGALVRVRRRRAHKGSS